MKPEESYHVNSPDVTKKTTMSEKIRVLYIDDEINNLISFKSNFRKHYEIFTASTAEEGIEILKNEKVHIILVDQRMPKISGVEFLESIIEKYPEPVRILLSGYTDMEALVDGVNKAHIYRHIGKPIKENEMAEAIEDSYKAYRSTNAQQTIADLTRVNEQLEFMLREKLAS